MSVSLLRSRPLARPSGRGPGFNPAHVAAGGTLFSAVASHGGAGGINVLTGKAGTITATVAASMDPVIGPACKISGSSARVVFTGQKANLATGNLTLAAIGSIQTFTSFACIVAAGLGSGSGYFLATGGTVGTLDIGVGGNSSGVITMTPALAANTPYLFVCTARPTNAAGFGTAWAVNLKTGVISTGNTTTAGFSAGDVNYMFGTPASFAIVTAATVATGMVSTTAMTTATVAQWARDPWGFWYPPTEFESLNWMTSPVTDVLMPQIWM